MASAHLQKLMMVSQVYFMKLPPFTLPSSPLPWSDGQPVLSSQAITSLNSNDIITHAETLQTWPYSPKLYTASCLC
ncbi:hypothetical protein HZ326_12814 [Fusarium oxysporum f. sp. albedinis]|nr:hypothetical protein HZ326_12814 [Fusarium oxysporum f. sp. albedinis]